MRRLLILCLALLSCSAPAWAEEVGRVVKLQGQAQADGRALAEGDRFDLGQRLSTGEGARLFVLLLDGTELTLGANAAMTIDELALSSQKASALFRLAQGAFRLVGGGVAKVPDHRMEVQTPLVTIGIRGTDVWGGSVKSPQDVFLIEGAVTVTTAGGTVLLNEPGQGTSVAAAGQAPAVPIFWPSQLKEQAFATVSFGK